MPRTPRQGWTDTYWDVLEQLYWTPKYLGLKSVPRKLWQNVGDRVSIPADQTNKNGPLYFRVLSTTDYWPYIVRQEETFNHLLDLTLSILSPIDTIELLKPLCHFPDGIEVAPLGRSINDFLGWPSQANYTQPDVFLAGERALAMIEIKFNAKTSLDQVGKYIALAVRALEMGRPLSDISLTYVFPGPNPKESLSNQLGLSIEALRALDHTRLAMHVGNSALRAVLSANPRLTKKVLQDIRVNAINWDQVMVRLDTSIENASQDQGGRTYANLLSGLREAIETHPLSKLRSS